ncbi:MAG: DNA gyrase subunit A, partial [bacterium]
MSDLKPLLDKNFLEYASYVIKERAIPDVEDGLKPVQRRILHTMYRMDDGKFNKVANVVGETMKLHPHGDASIGQALVVLANKEYFIEKQGNFGNIFTGDPPSAARYIEARLTPLAKEVLFNPDLTETEESYDGRNREPLALPCKIPATLLLGAEGIAVGMSTRILPHNFNEVLEAQVAFLEGRPFELFPDFLTGGLLDISQYREGNGKVRSRALIQQVDERTLVIK